jgi:hypothetical protein
MKLVIDILLHCYDIVLKHPVCISKSSILLARWLGHYLAHVSLYIYSMFRLHGAIIRYI